MINLLTIGKPARKRARQKSRGFTVMEAIISFTILTLSFAGFAGMIVNSLRNFRASQEKYIAAKIAQEGMELVLNKKDNHVQCEVANPSCPLTSWLEGLSYPVNTYESYEVEATRSNELTPGHTFPDFNDQNHICILNNPPQHKGKFGYIGTGACDNLSPNYTREVVVYSLNSFSIYIRSVVTWRDTKTLTLEAVAYGR